MTIEGKSYITSSDAVFNFSNRYNTFDNYSIKEGTSTKLYGCNVSTFFSKW